MNGSSNETVDLFDGNDSRMTFEIETSTKEENVLFLLSEYVSTPLFPFLTQQSIDPLTPMFLKKIRSHIHHVKPYPLWRQRRSGSFVEPCLGPSGKCPISGPTNGHHWPLLRDGSALWKQPVRFQCTWWCILAWHKQTMMMLKMTTSFIFPGVTPRCWEGGRRPRWCLSSRSWLRCASLQKVGGLFLLVWYPELTHLPLCTIY